MNTRFFSAARVLLLATLLFGPLAFGAVQPWAWGTMVVASAVIFLLWMAGNLRQKYLYVTWSWMYVPAGLLFLFALFQSTAHFSVDPAGTREAVIKLAMCLALFFLTVQLYGKAPRAAWDQLGTFVVLFALGLSLFAILQCFSSPRMIYWQVKSPNDDFGPYVDRDHYAGLMEMLIPIAASYRLSLDGSVSRSLLATFSVLVAVVSLLLTGSRGGFLALIAEFSLFALLVVALRSERRRLALALSAVGLAAAAGGFLLTIAPDSIPGRLASVVHFRDPSVTRYRPAVTADSLRIFGDYRASGTGLGTFEAIYPQYQSFSTETYWDHAHNDYAEFLAETGLPGAILAFAGFAIFVRAAFFKGLQGRLHSTPGWVQLGAALGCCGLLVHSVFDFNLHIPANAGWFSVCVGLATLKRASSGRSRLQHGDEPGIAAQES